VDYQFNNIVSILRTGCQSKIVHEITYSLSISWILLETLFMWSNLIFDPSILKFNVYPTLVDNLNCSTNNRQKGYVENFFCATCFGPQLGLQILMKKISNCFYSSRHQLYNLTWNYNSIQPQDINSLLIVSFLNL
jgi:hypothetical protein